MDEKLKKSQKRYLQVFGIVVVVLAFVRAVGGGVRSDLVTPPAAKDSIDLSDSLRFVGDSAGGYLTAFAAVEFSNRVRRGRGARSTAER